MSHPRSSWCGLVQAPGTVTKERQVGCKAFKGMSFNFFRTLWVYKLRNVPALALEELACELCF